MLAGELPSDPPLGGEHAVPGPSRVTEARIKERKARTGTRRKIDAVLKRTD